MFRSYKRCAIQLRSGTPLTYGRRTHWRPRKTCRTFSDTKKIFADTNGLQLSYDSCTPLHTLQLRACPKRPDWSGLPFTLQPPLPARAHFRASGQPPPGVASTHMPISIPMERSRISTNEYPSPTTRVLDEMSRVSVAILAIFRVLLKAK